MLTFGRLVRHHAAHAGDKAAYVEADRRVTWRELDRRTDALAHALVALGIRPGDRVAMLAADCIETAEVFLACAKAGAVRVGLNHRLAGPEIVALLADCRPGLLVVQGAHERLLAGGDGIAAGLPRIGFAGHAAGLDYETLIDRHRRDGAFPEAPHELVMIAYTTGSTGLPKGAIYRHDRFLGSILYTAALEGIMTDSVWLHAMPAAGIPVMHMLRNIFHGATTAIVGPWDPERALHLLERERATNVVLVPTMLNSLLACGSFGRHDVGSMRLLGYGASPLPPATIREAMQAFRCPFLQMYGTTELGGMSMMLMPADHALGIASRPELLASAGKPLPFVEVGIVDDDGRPLPRGEVGELVVRSETMFAGYWEAPEKDAEALRDGWLHTGDMARQDAEGYVFLSDRAKFRIKTGGYNVFPTEVENVLADHPAVDEVAVIGLPDPTWGERIHAVVSLKPGATAATDALRAFCRDKIAGYKLPKTLDIWAELPKGPTGKIQKRAIIEHYLAAAEGAGGRAGEDRA